MNTLRVWLIHRLGGVDKPAPPKPFCLKRGYYSNIGTPPVSYATASTISIYCKCPDCKREAAFESGRRTVRRHGESLRMLAEND
jgi:hypothetical protein